MSSKNINRNQIKDRLDLFFVQAIDQPYEYPNFYLNENQNKNSKTSNFSRPESDLNSLNTSTSIESPPRSKLSSTKSILTVFNKNCFELKEVKAKFQMKNFLIENFDLKIKQERQMKFVNLLKASELMKNNGSSFRGKIGKSSGNVQSGMKNLLTRPALQKLSLIKINN